MATRDEITCIHHWMVPTTDMEMVEGICRKCGERRLFHNRVDWVELFEEKHVKPATPPELEAVEELALVTV